MAESNGQTELAGLSNTELRAYHSLVERYQFAEHAGLQFPKDGLAGFHRDLYQALGYTRELRPEDYRSRYERGGIAERIIEALPKATWRGGGNVVENEDPDDDTEFELAWKSLDDRLGVWSTLMRADILAGLGRYGIVVIGDGNDLEEKLSFRGMDASPDSVLYLAPYGEEDATIQEVDEDSSSERFGLPTVYEVSIGTVTSLQGKSRGDTKKVHHSRVIHVVDGALRDEVYGKPRLRSSYNYLDDLEKIHGAGAEAFWQRADPLTQFNIDPSVDMGTVDVDALDDEIDMVRHGLLNYVRSQGLEINRLSADVSPFAANLDGILTLISGTTGIPKRILLGSERGELASQQDRANWNERVATRRMEFATGVVRELVDRLLEHGALPEPAEPYDVIWPEIESLDEKEKTDLAARMAEINERSVRSGEGPVFAVSEIREVTGRAPESEIEGLRAAERFDDADVVPDEPEWKSVHRAADAHVDRVAEVIERELGALRTSLDTGRIRDALERRDRTRAMRVVQDALAAIDREALTEALHAVLVEGANAASRSSHARGGFLRAAQLQMEMEFDGTNPEALHFAQAQAGELITNVSDETIASVRSLIVNSFKEGAPPALTARQIRNLIDLTEQHAQAVSALQTELESAEGGELFTRMDGRFRVRVPEGGADSEFIERRVGQYRERLRSYRARNIARTETIKAANEGQRQLWTQAQERGLLPTDVQKVWIGTPDGRMCPECATLDGETARVDDSFSTGIQRPPQHPSCRCAIGLQRGER